MHKPHAVLDTFFDEGVDSFFQNIVEISTI